MASRPPSIDALADSLDDGRLPRALLVDVVRRAVEEWRSTGGDPVEAARHAVEVAARAGLPGVINATGVLLHTNLGRALLHPEASRAAAEASAKFSALELDLTTGRRGGRGRRAHELVCSLTGAEAALVVNNNAGALLLAVAALAGGSGIVVSRGELIEIGGSFRLPEVIAAAGAEVIEVGTTNRTHLDDYRKAMSGSARAVLKVHPSNYRVEGFSAEVSYRDLATMAADASIGFVADVGSGLLDERVPWVDGPPPRWLAGEPGARQVLDAGADLVLFSGDKLLGGPQAGIIAGKAETVAVLARHPIARAVRIGGVPLAALTATLGLYASGRGSEIPFWRMAGIAAEDLQVRAEAVVAAAGVGEIVEGDSVVGGGSVPGAAIPSPVVAVPGAADDFRSRLLVNDPPVVARVDRDQLVVDLRAVAPEDDSAVARALAAACR